MTHSFKHFIFYNIYAPLGLVCTCTCDEYTNFRTQCKKHPWRFELTQCMTQNVYLRKDVDELEDRLIYLQQELANLQMDLDDLENGKK